MGLFRLEKLMTGCKPESNSFFHLFKHLLSSLVVINSCFELKKGIGAWPYLKKLALLDYLLPLRHINGLDPALIGDGKYFSPSRRGNNLPISNKGFQHGAFFYRDNPYRGNRVICFWRVRITISETNRWYGKHEN
jgi:hypothetical protein